MKKFTEFVFVFFLLLFAPLLVEAGVPAEGLSEVVGKLSPAVVNISSEYRLKMDNQGLCSNPAIFQEFAEFCERVRPFFKGKVPQKKYGTSLGSGFLISSDGLIVTNYHVISHADKIKVSLNHSSDVSQQYDAKVIGYDKRTDLAALKISGVNGLPHLKFGDSSTMKPGDLVIAVGNPFGLGGSVSAGIISAISREIGLSQSSDFIQTDVVLNSGSSGGPLCNIKGEVIGVNTAAVYSNGGSVGIGFAVPANVAKNVVEALAKGEEIERGWIGIVIQEIEEGIQKALGKSVSGVLVSRVEKGSPAYKAGLMVGDIVTAVDGEKIVSSRKIVREISSRKVGDTVKLSILRDVMKNKQELNVTVKLAKLHSRDLSDSFSEIEVIGVFISNLSDNLRSSFGIAAGIDGIIILAVDPDKDTFLRAGDIIVSAGDRKNLSSVLQFKEVIEEARKRGQKSILLLINRGKQSIFAAINLDD